MHTASRRGILHIAMMFLAVLMLFTALQMAQPERFGAAGAFLDFHVFYLVGQAGAEGEIGRVYSAEGFLPMQQARAGFSEYLPYSYPPHASLAMMALALVPDWLGYLVFTGGSVAALVWVVWRLAPTYAPEALLLVMPGLFVAVRSGQNGALSAALVGLVCLWWARRGLAGVPLGVLSYKPHLALGLGLAALLKLRLWVVVVAVLALLAGCGAATLVFGPGVWADFLGAARESTGFLEEGLFPFHRMASVYAFGRSIGLTAGPAMFLQAVPAVMAVLALAVACLAEWQARRMLALSVMAGLLISPYLYDYDIVAASVALALAGADLTAARARMRWLLGVGVVMATGWGAIHGVLTARGIDVVPAFGGLGLVLAFAGLMTVLAQAERSERDRGL